VIVNEKRRKSTWGGEKGNSSPVLPREIIIQLKDMLREEKTSIRRDEQGKLLTKWRGAKGKE